MTKLFGRSLFIASILVLVIACSDDADVKNDTGAGPDQGTTVDALVPDQGPTPNSGAICTGSGQGTCKHPKDLCVYLPGASKGVCLAQCKPGDTCEKPKGPYATECAITYHMSTGTTYVCGWYCQHQAQTYKCPNATDYKCEAWSTTTPNIKFCFPK